MFNGNVIISSDWQSGVNNAASGGQILGLLINGWAQTRYGYRTVYMIGMVAMTACIFVLFFAVNIEMILVGNLLAGIPWGIFQVSISQPVWTGEMANYSGHHHRIRFRDCPSRTPRCK